ncbi:MAG: TolC family protein [Phycisphaerae bacterium]|nr:TolC family protein [Phycisphaerae bacterium]
MKYIKDHMSYLLLALLMGCTQPGSQSTPASEYSENNYLHDPIVSESTNKSSQDATSKAEPNGILTLGDVLALTLVHNPELNIFSLETRAAQARELQAGLWPNPEIGVEVENVGGTGELSGFDGAETTLQLSQLIELGDKSQKRKNVASFEKELANLDYQNKRLDVFSDAAKAFISVLKAQEKLQLSSELLKLSDESFQIVEKKVTAGKDSPVEKNRAAVALANTKMSYHEDRQNLDYARKQLASFWGQNEPLFERAAGDMENIGPLLTLENLTGRLKLNPEYTRWESEIKKNRAILDLEKSRAIGDITIGAGLRRFNESDDNAFVFGVSIPLPLSDRNQGAKQEAVYNLAKSREEKKAAWLKLQNEFNQTYREYANSFHQATSLKNEVLPAAIDMFNAATKGYEQGKIDYLNVLDAQRTLFSTKGEYVNALAECHIRKTELERLIGQTLETTELIEKRGTGHE